MSARADLIQQLAHREAELHISNQMWAAATDYAARLETARRLHEGRVSAEARDYTAHVADITAAHQKRIDSISGGRDGQ